MVYFIIFILLIVIAWLLIPKQKKQKIKTLEIESEYEISDPNDKDEAQAYHFFKLAQKCYHRNEFNKAIEHYNNAINYKKHFVFFNNRGCAKCYVEQYGSAIDDFTIAISLNPEIALIFLNRGWTYFAIEKKELACKDWRQAAALGSERAAELTRQYCPRIAANRLKTDREPLKPKKKIVRKEQLLEVY